MCFYGIKTLEFIYIRDGARITLGNHIFNGSTALTDTILPSTVTIDGTNFEGCTAVTIYTPNDSNAAKYAAEHFIPYNTDQFALQDQLYSVLYGGDPIQ